MELLKQLYKIHSPSGKEGKIRTFVMDYITKNISNVHIQIDAVGNLLAVKGESETYPCVVAHLDQVQKSHSRDFRVVETDEIIFGYSFSNRRREGLGADDKNGIWIALQCLLKCDTIKTAFFVGEEIGCVGSSSVNVDFFSDCRFIIEPDRRGCNDIVTRISWESLCSEEFLHDIKPERFGYFPTDGLMTDIETLRENGLEISCINLSCGYYDPHTDYEFTVKRDLINCLDFVQYIIDFCKRVYPHEVLPYCYQYSFCEDDYAEMLLEITTSHPEYSVKEIWDVFQTNFPGLTQEDFELMCDEYTVSWE